MYTIGQKIRIIHLNGERNEYDGREGTITHIDGIGQLHGTWGSLAVIPEKDEFELIETSEMMDVNRVLLQGTVGTIREISIQDDIYKSFSLATTRIQKLKDQSAIAETTWHMVRFKQTPDYPFPIQKGDTVKVQGYIRQLRYASANGEERTFDEIVAEKAEIIKSSNS